MILPGTAEKLSEVAVANHVTFFPLPEMVLKGVNRSHLPHAIGDVMTVFVLKHFFVARPTIKGNSLTAVQSKEKHSSYKHCFHFGNLQRVKYFLFSFPLVYFLKTTQLIKKLQLCFSNLHEIGYAKAILTMVFGFNITELSKIELMSKCHKASLEMK